MTQIQQLANHHNFCVWSVHQGGAVPFHAENTRPDLANLSTVDKIEWLGNNVLPLLPGNTQGKIGIELHVRKELNAENMQPVMDVLMKHGLHMGMITPGLHHTCAQGGPMSLNKAERGRAADTVKETVDLAYRMQEVWPKDMAPTLVLWNGGHNRLTQGPEIRDQWKLLVEARADLYAYERDAGNRLYHGGESKPNEGHPVLVPQTEPQEMKLVDSAMELAGISESERHRYGLNPETGHLCLVPGLDPAATLAPYLDRIVHFHPNSQGEAPTGSTLGGPGMYDVDHEAKVNPLGITIAYMLRESGFARMFGHDFQPRPSDTSDGLRQAAARSVLAVETCWLVSDPTWGGNWQADRLKALANNDVRKATDILDDVHHEAHRIFREACITAGVGEASRFLSVTP